ncbi:MAG: MTH1187 family thiamine-binding protein [Nitrososphaerales archaeon]
MSGEKRLTIIAEISVFPVSEGTSLSPYVKKAVEAISSVEGLRFQVTPMGTILEATSLEQILEAFKRAHKAVKEAGAKRIVAQLKVDDRLDKPRRMEDKVKAVLETL